MSNTSSPSHRNKRNRKGLQPALWVLCIIIAGLTAAALLLNKPRSHYPEVNMQVGDSLRLSFLHQPYAEAPACENTVSKVVAAMKNVCPDCTIVGQRCLQKLSPRQKLFLDGAAVDVPVMRLPSAVISFEAADPAIAQQTCNVSAAQTGGNNTCASPDPAKLAMALTETSHQHMQSTLSPATLAKLTVFAALTSFLICAFIIWSERWHARFSHDAVDSGPQKFHSTPVPRIGGVAIACAIGAVIAALDYTDILPLKVEQGFALLALAALLAFGGGLAEDLTKKVGVLARLLLTMAAGVLASVLVGATLDRLDVPGLDNLLQYWPLFAIAFTAFAVGGVANAMNIIDGYNGLAGGYSIIALAALAWVASQVGDQVVLLASLTMLGAMAGFLAWNWPSGKIFLGDGGAYLLGFWLAELGVLLVVRNPEVSPWFPFAVMAYPVWETLFSMYRRKIIRQRHVGHPDAMHLHQLIYHRLIRCAVGSKAPTDQHRRNNAVAPYLIPPIALLMLPALLVWDHTEALLACAGLFGVAYVWLYRRIAHRRAARWMIRI
jgi:UDP-N-acetylmuramyl pentapeptide phosphotransferase/UDP-N-acetylglucosamine-1-phosphate transferase